ncbi:hypothetical protein B0T25DRAFT_351290 [Lasiosphaeria hispida]|uniref:Uncharacterized protein n=1 Tax=Lasiosphaeria hispida TaxID=260671 RepID=A0AAJ0M8E7_9PEZI|nr:hypothetical protein B0T25DRAFT_351290 [Lasiosphaeria hispida]
MRNQLSNEEGTMDPCFLTHTYTSPSYLSHFGIPAVFRVKMRRGGGGSTASPVLLRISGISMRKRIRIGVLCLMSHYPPLPLASSCSGSKAKNLEHSQLSKVYSLAGRKTGRVLECPSSPLVYSTLHHCRPATTAKKGRAADVQTFVIYCAARPANCAPGRLPTVKSRIRAPSCFRRLVALVVGLGTQALVARFRVSLALARTICLALEI